MVLSVALADNQDDVRRSERAAVHFHLVLCLDKAVDLLRCQLVGEDAEYKTVDRKIELGALAGRQLMFYGADGVQREPLPAV